MIHRRLFAAIALFAGVGAARAQSTIGDAQTTSQSMAVSVDNIAALRRLRLRPAVVWVSGYHREGDGGGGMFRWVSGDSAVDDDPLAITPGDGPPGKYRRIVNGPINAKWFGAKGDGISDDTEALQRSINFCAADEPFGPALYLPGGQYKITSGLTIPLHHFQMHGDGMWKSRILFNDVPGAALTAAKMRYLKPVLRDFAVVGNEKSGKGIDFSQVELEVYLGELRNILIESGDDGLYSIRFFSMIVDNVCSTSHRGHCFRVSCGPAVSWRNCYAISAGPGKAGYRLLGTVALYSCNGINKGDYWGVFGCDPTAKDGFQDDFEGLDYADVTMVECNVEDFCSGQMAAGASAIVLHNYYRQFNMVGGKIDRNNLSTPYHSIIRSRKGPIAPGAAIRLSPGSVFLGQGKPTAGYLYSDGRSFFADQIGSLAHAGITTWREADLDHSVISSTAVRDPFGLVALHYPGLSAGTLTVNAMRFSTARQSPGEGSLLSMGRTMLATANTAPTTVNTIKCTAALGQNQHSSETALLVVKVEDSFTTFKHEHDSEDGLRLRGNKDYLARQGDVLLFFRSNFFDGRRAGWVQV